MAALLIASLFLLALLASGTVIAAMLLARYEDIMLALLGEGVPAAETRMIMPEAGLAVRTAAAPRAAGQFARA